LERKKQVEKICIILSVDAKEFFFCFANGVAFIEVDDSYIGNKGNKLIPDEFQ
jgi:hypothetical protein